MQFDDDKRYLFKIKPHAMFTTFELTMMKNSHLIGKIEFDNVSHLCKMLCQSSNPSVSQFVNLILDHAGFSV